MLEFSLVPVVFCPSKHSVLTNPPEASSQKSLPSKNYENRKRNMESEPDALRRVPKKAAQVQPSDDPSPCVVHQEPSIKTDRTIATSSPVGTTSFQRKANIPTQVQVERQAVTHGSSEKIHQNPQTQTLIQTQTETQTHNVVDASKLAAEAARARRKEIRKSKRTKNN
ncbi:PREDICTED: uncharacterized protein LOC104811412 isoform X2 [Tarenaya hassleriana]|uniref:uncharacterized protein LOC104811412 isoform X2 n=1 Tax=Tarenaya hassleriana TaxID=28532 RepID=UPI00053C9771|nr:PREDICTED: uncharacterized protein LOC104811412 isoform X2 [Tarenaya hassleriana]